MALHRTPDEHDANPPRTWQVRKVSPHRWDLCDATGAVLGSYPTKKRAEQDKVTGPYVALYEKEGRWFAGEPVPGWKPYAPLG
ncbi:hypothetical protein E1091_19295 [Micromonospora fluostatini]|uniref:Uncharacterized protein n=1 Tax=Micromonospora fluostatini TaxID=1629071 RepID=A0ABY2DCK1_9ACTN|nr:hypothetical protein E1091_19295 [Micromonospora fluostatini]